MIVGINTEFEFKRLDCSKIEMYESGGISFKDDNDGILFTLHYKSIKHMSIIESES